MRALSDLMEVSWEGEGRSSSGDSPPPQNLAGRSLAPAAGLATWSGVSLVAGVALDLATLPLAGSTNPL